MTIDFDYDKLFAKPEMSESMRGACPGRPRRGLAIATTVVRNSTSRREAAAKAVMAYDDDDDLDAGTAYCPLDDIGTSNLKCTTLLFSIGSGDEYVIRLCPIRGEAAALWLHRR